MRRSARVRVGRCSSSFEYGEVLGSGCLGHDQKYRLNTFVCFQLGAGVVRALCWAVIEREDASIVLDQVLIFSHCLRSTLVHILERDDHSVAEHAFA